MKKILFLLALFFVCFSIQETSAQLISIDNMKDHIKGMVFTGRFGSASYDHSTPGSFMFASYGFSFLIRPDTIRERIKQRVISYNEKCVADTTDSCFSPSRLTVAFGYEYAPFYTYPLDNRASKFQLKGFYGGLFYNIPERLHSHHGFFHWLINLPHWIGATAELTSISDATAIIRDSSGHYSIPIKYSSESIISPEIYLGGSLSKDRTNAWSHIFIDLSYQWMAFHSISYSSELDDSKIKPDKYIQLPERIFINTFFITIGVSLIGNPLGN